MARLLQWCSVLSFVTILSYSDCRRISFPRRIPTSFSFAKPKPSIHYDFAAVRKPSSSSYPSSSSIRKPGYPVPQGRGGYAAFPGGNGTGPGGFGRYAGNFEPTHTSSFGNIYNSAALSLSLYSLMQDSNHYHFYYPNSKPTSDNGNSNYPAKGSFSTQIGNMTCISVYNAREVNKWASNTLNDFRTSFPRTTAEGFNFTVVHGEIIHNETLAVTCCGTEKNVVNLAELTSGKNSDVNCVFKEFNMPFRKLKFIPINGTSISGTATGTNAIGRTARSGG